MLIRNIHRASSDRLRISFVTLANITFGTLKIICVSYVFFNAEFKSVIRLCV
jgi:hypothetical protein